MLLLSWLALLVQPTLGFEFDYLASNKCCIHMGKDFSTKIKTHFFYTKIIDSCLVFLQVNGIFGLNQVISSLKFCEKKQDASTIS